MMIHQKPLPNETIYKHLMMLANYCKEASAYKPISGYEHRVPEREKAHLNTWHKLQALANSRSVRKLLDYGE